MDPAIGRFTSIDPLAEKYYSWSPYVYVGNNPLKYIDPDGRQVGLPISPMGYGITNRLTKSMATAYQSTKTYSGSGGIYHFSRVTTREVIGINNNASGIGGALVVSLAQHSELNLTGSAISKMQADPAMQQAESGFINDMKTDKGFAKDGVYSKTLTVQFGGSRGDGDGGWTLKGGMSAASNELTWLVRNADISANAVRGKDGKITITYSLSPNEKLDVRPNGSEASYDKVTTVLGTVYHDILGGNDQLRTKATWTTIIDNEKENK